jgi:hypothetical protein
MRKFETRARYAKATMFVRPTLLALGLVLGLGCSSADTSGGGGATGGGGGNGGAATSGGATGGGGASSVGGGDSGGGAASGAGAGGSSSSSGGSGGAGGFDPGSLAGLELWLVGDHASTDGLGHVSTWPDETSHHHDATQLQNAALAPSLSTHAANFNGHGVVHFQPCNRLEIPDHGDGPDFDSREDSYLVVVAANAGGSDLAYLAVKQVASPSLSLFFGFGMHADEQTSGFAADLFRPADEHYFSATTTSYGDGVPRVYSVKSRGGKLITAVNGSVVATVDSSPKEEFIKGAPLEIGASSLSGCFDGDIAEMIMLGNPNDDTDALEGWLMAKYGL